MKEMLNTELDSINQQQRNSMVTYLTDVFCHFLHRKFADFGIELTQDNMLDILVFT